jgi:hypothetical protein
MDPLKRERNLKVKLRRVYTEANKFVLDAVIGAALYGIYESNDDNN